MSNEQFKNYLQRDKIFLKGLYKAESKAKIKRFLTFASDGELTTLIKYIHLVCNGEIHIKKKNFEALETQIHFIKKNFEKKAVFQKLNQSTRLQKLKVLSRLQSIYSNLLFPLFNE